MTCVESKEGYSGTVLMGDDYDTIEVAFQNVRPKTKSILGMPYGTYSLTVEDIKIVLDVTEGEKGGTDHILRLEELEMGYYGTMEELEMTLHTSDKKSTAAKPKGNQVDITEDILNGDVDEIFENMGYELQNIAGDLAGIR